MTDEGGEDETPPLQVKLNGVATIVVEKLPFLRRINLRLQTIASKVNLRKLLAPATSGLKGSRVHFSTTIGIIAIQYIALTIFRVGIVKAAIHFGLISNRMLPQSRNNDPTLWEWGE
ncbi:hypothetical protein Q3G72_031286 [Acer saccharum]|nr:hypothetical protein Q3G72_031286 [Acer saccharum]